MTHTYIITIPEVTAALVMGAIFFLSVGFLGGTQLRDAIQTELKQRNSELYEELAAALRLAQKLNDMASSRDARGRFVKREAK